MHEADLLTLYWIGIRKLQTKTITLMYDILEFQAGSPLSSPRILLVHINISNL
jgi:hypothetical protein